MKKLINFFKSLFNKKPAPKSTKSVMQDVSDRLEPKVTNKKTNNIKNSKNTTGDTLSVNNELEEIL
jgi:hypothetical protein